jgi:hypothetical protein
MKTFRSFALCMLMALVLIMVPAILAQEETFGLSDADWELFTAANAAMSEVDSASFAFTASFSVTGTGGMSANVSGEGVLSSDEANPQFALVVTGESQSEGETTPIDAEVRLLGDTLYWIDNTGDDGWQGQTVEDLTSQLGGMAGMSGMGVDPESLSSGDLSGLAGMEGMTDAMTALSSLDPSEFITMSRTDADGAAQFTIDLSISDLLSSPAIAPLFGMGMAAGAGAEGAEMDEEQMQAMVGMMAAMFSEATVTLDQFVDPATSETQRIVLDVSVPIPDMSGSGSPTTIALNFDLNLSGYGEAVSVETPTDVTMLESGE